MKMAVASSGAAIRGLRFRGRRPAAFTLPEVMIALVLVSALCLSTFVGMRLVSNLAMTTAIRSEAHRLMQAEAERLMSVGYGSFVASSAVNIPAVLKTTFRPGTEARLAPAPGTAGRVTFVRRVVEVASTSTTRTLRVEVQWTWLGKTTVISVRVFRSQ